MPDSPTLPPTTKLNFGMFSPYGDVRFHRLNPGEIRSCGGSLNNIKEYYFACRRHCDLPREPVLVDGFVLGQTLAYIVELERRYVELRLALYPTYEFDVTF